MLNYDENVQEENLPVINMEEYNNIITGKNDDGFINKNKINNCQYINPSKRIFERIMIKLMLMLGTIKMKKLMIKLY